MKKVIALSVMVFGLLMQPLESKASNKHDKDRYEHKYDKKHHHKQHKKAKQRHKSNDTFYKLPSGLYKKVSYSRPSVSAKRKSYRRGDKLDIEVYNRGRLLKRDKRKGVVVLEIDKRIYHLMRDTREILSIIVR